MGAATPQVTPAPPRGRGALLDREDALAALVGVVEEARSGHRAAVVLTGPPGAGRSRLLREAEAVARAAGCDVRTARGLALGEGGAVEVLDPLLRRPRNSAALVLVVDDAHLADPASRALLGALAGARVAAGPVPDALAGRWARLVAGGGVGLIVSTRAHDAPAWRPVPGVHLAPLGARAVAAAVRGVFGPAADARFCRACATQTAGNPRALHDLLNAAAAAGVRPTADGVAQLEAIALDTAAHAVTAALATCSPDAMALVAALAICTGDDTADPVALAGLDAERARAAAATLVAAGVLRRAAPAAFASPATRRAVSGAVAPGLWGDLQRQAAHARAARAFPGDTRAAAHLLDAPPQGDPWVVTELRRAAAIHVERGRPDRAVALLHRAMQEPPEGAVRPALAFELSLAEAACGHGTAAARMRQALELQHEPALQARVALALARLLATRGEYRRAAALIDEVSRRLAPADEQLAAELRAAVVSIDPSRAGARADTAGRLAAVLAQPPGADTAADRVLLVEAAHEGALRNRDCAELVALARRGWGDGRLLAEETPESPAIAALSAVLCWAGALEEDVALLSAALTAARGRGAVLAEATARAGRAWPLYMLGRLDAAWEDACAAREAERLGWAMFIATSRAVAAHIAIDRGDLTAAGDALALPAEARWTSARLRGPYFAPYFDARARLHLAEGRFAHALADAEAVGELLARATGTSSSALVPWRCTAAAAHARAGRADAALALADEEVALGRASGNARLLGIGLRTRGLLLGATDGLPDLTASVRVLSGSEAALELARSRCELGAALRRAGKRGASRAPLRAALAAAELAGAAPLATRAADELAASGSRAPAGQGSGTGHATALTPSERRVAALAADGLTNRAIAETLQISAQTVNWHLGNAYRKLGVGRATLAGALAGTGDPAPDMAKGRP